MGGSTGDLLGTGNSGGGAFAQPMTGADYNRRLQAGESSQAIRDSQRGGFFGTGQGLSDNQFNDIVTQAGMQSPTGRPLAGSAQFYQPVYQPQFQNSNMGNPMSVSQYGQQPSFGGGFMPQQQFQQPMQQFMPQQQFQPQMNMGMQTPFQQPMQQTQSPLRSSGPTSPIVGRSSQMRGTPNVMRRAQGGITSLMDEA